MCCVTRMVILLQLYLLPCPSEQLCLFLCNCWYLGQGQLPSLMIAFIFVFIVFFSVKLSQRVSSPPLFRSEGSGSANTKVAALSPIPPAWVVMFFSEIVTFLCCFVSLTDSMILVSHPSYLLGWIDATLSSMWHSVCWKNTEKEDMRFQVWGNSAILSLSVSTRWNLDRKKE